MATTQTIESVISAFPYASIKPIVGAPTYESINEVATLLKANASAIHTENGGGQLGYLALTVSPAVYALLAPNTPFVIPVNPGATPPALANANPTAAQITENIRQHAARLSLFRHYNTVNSALKQQLLAAVPDIYIRTLKNRHTAYANVSTNAILAHLYTTYGRITPMDLDANDTRFRAAYDPSQPFETFVQQLEDAQDYADAGGNPYTAEQILANAYSIMFRTGMFNETCREWRRADAAAQTWQNFKTQFALAHSDLADLRATTQSAGFQQANNAMEAFATETADAFANLAMAATADRDLLRSLQATNQTLLQQITVNNAELTQLRNLVQQYQAGLSNRTNNTNTNRRNNNRPAGKPPATTPPVPANGPGPKRFPNLNYCWTHGYDIDPRHDSTTCRYQADGHQTTATRSNNLGGSQKNKEPTV